MTMGVVCPYFKNMKPEIRINRIINKLTLVMKRKRKKIEIPMILRLFLL